MLGFYYHESKHVIKKNRLRRFQGCDESPCWAEKAARVDRKA